MLRIVGTKLILDDRKDFKFTTSKGLLVGTKSASEKEARAHIEECLKVKLKEVV